METAKIGCQKVLLLPLDRACPGELAPVALYYILYLPHSTHMHLYFYSVNDGGDRNFFNQHFWLSCQGIHISLALRKSLLPFQTHQASRNDSCCRTYFASPFRPLPIMMSFFGLILPNFVRLVPFPTEPHQGWNKDSSTNQRARVIAIPLRSPLSGPITSYGNVCATGKYIIQGG